MFTKASMRLAVFLYFEFDTLFYFKSCITIGLNVSLRPQTLKNFRSSWRSYVHLNTRS
jgi:hypothetical protein